MKKILILLTGSLFYISCTSSEIVSETTMRKALNIAHEQAQKQFTQTACSNACADAYVYLNVPVWNDKMDCKLLDVSDVSGAKFVKGCFLEGAMKQAISASTGLSLDINTDIVVMAQYLPSNKDIILLAIYEDAKRTKEGFAFIPYASGTIKVNLKTRKIGEL